MVKGENDVQFCYGNPDDRCRDHQCCPCFFSSQMAGFVFFGVLMIGFGIVELVRSRNIKKQKKAARDREFDLYNMVASQMGVKINPLTGEMLGECKSDEQTDPDNETVKQQEN